MYDFRVYQTLRSATVKVFMDLWDKNKVDSLLLPLPHEIQTAGTPMTEERKHAILFAATLLSARKLLEMDADKPNMAKGYIVDKAIEDAAFILERIDKKWPAEALV